MAVTTPVNNIGTEIEEAYRIKLEGNNLSNGPNDKQPFFIFSDFLQKKL